MKGWHKSARLPVATWLIALGIHGLLLTIPITSISTKKPPKPESGRVRVTLLPQEAAQKQAAEPKLIKPSVSPLQVPRQTPQTPQPRPTPSPRVQKQPVSQKSRSQSARPRRTKASPPKPVPTPTPSIAPGDLVVNLGRLPNTKPCKNVDGCWQSNNSQWRSVYQNVQQQLSEQGYQLTELELEDDTGFRVSQVSKNGATKYYLHLVSTLQGTVYVLNPTQLNKDEVDKKLDNPS